MFKPQKKPVTNASRTLTEKLQLSGSLQEVNETNTNRDCLIRITAVAVTAITGDHVSSAALRGLTNSLSDLLNAIVSHLITT